MRRGLVGAQLLLMRALPLTALLVAMPALAQEVPAVQEAAKPVAPAAAQAAPSATPAAPSAAAPVASPVAAAPGVAVKPAAGTVAAPRPAGLGVTPNAERIVAIGAINKRTGETRTFVGKPGQTFDFGGLHVTVRTCETTPPWEQRLTGAFLLIDERMQKGAPRRVYSGWMFAESPSLHPLEHRRYDIWVKSCTMRFPDTGPETVVIGRGDAGAAKSEPKASSAKKSAATPSAKANLAP